MEELPENSTHQDQVENLRAGVDDIDDNIMRLLAERRQLSTQIANEKKLSHRPYRDEEREQLLLSKRAESAEAYDLEPGLVIKLWEQILDDSVRLQHDLLQGEINGGFRPTTVAIQGIEGSFSHLATEQFFRNKPTDVSLLSCTRFADVIEAVELGHADLAVLPIENTTSGGIAEVYDLLLHSRLSVVGEVKLLVRHCLLGTPDSSISRLKTVYGHPQAVTQCSDFLSGLTDVEVMFFGDTAMSGQRIKEMADPTIGAIASEQAASMFGLQVLKSAIANRKQNYTRFLVVARDSITVDPQVPSKTSLVLGVGNEPGALMEVLSEFSARAIPLVKLESRPTIDNPWEEMFYVDFEGNLSDDEVKAALDGTKRSARYVRVLGSYPSEDLRPHRRKPAEARTRGETSKAPHIVVRSAEQPNGYRLASRQHKLENSIIDVGGVQIGSESMFVIAGPCAVESLDQVMEAARAVKAAGGTMLRGGCFKPRTSPYSFQGLGYEGLEMLAEAGRAHGLPIVTEVPAPEEVERMSTMADVLQIGARNMQNFTLLSEVGRSSRPVMLKRGMSASLDELLQAAEYILSAGNQQVFLCERGIRTFETSTRNTLDIAAVPVLKGRTHLPIIVDPSHAAGSRELVVPLALAAQAAGADGIMVEIHPNPDEALSDGPQALGLDAYADLMKMMGF